MTRTEISELTRRINYSGSLEPTLETLSNLHRAWVHSIPFENLDIHLGRAIVLDPPAIFEKIVRHRRGGFCFEQNGLLATLLGEIGFDVALLAAAVVTPTGVVGPDFAHLSLLISIGKDRWIADVGFGEWSTDPLRFILDAHQGMPGELYRIVASNDRFFSERLTISPTLPKGYMFSSAPRALGDFSGLCQFFQTDPSSPFRKHKMCTRRTPSGRVTLADDKLIVTAHSCKTETVLDGERAYAAALRDEFGLEFTAEELSRMWSRTSQP